MVPVNAVALAHSLDRDAGWVAVKRGGITWRQRHDAGCSINRARPTRLPDAGVLGR